MYPRNTQKRISHRQAWAMMRSHEAKCTILDVRSLGEYRTGHIQGALNMPDSEIENRAPMMLLDKHAPILVYCKGGTRSKKAASSLASLGYTNVYDIGGINSWPYELV